MVNKVYKTLQLINKNKYIRCVSLVGIIILFSVCIESFFYNFNALKNDRFVLTYTSEELNSNLKDEHNSIVLEFDGIYVNKLRIVSEAKSNFDYNVILDVTNGYNNCVRKEICEKYYSDLSFSVIKLDDNINSIEIITPKDININNVTVSNEFVFNKYRFLFVLGVVIIFYLIIFCKKIYEGKLEYAFIIIALIIGGLMIVCKPQSFMSWDEHIHFNNVNKCSYSDEYMYSGASYMFASLTVPNVDTYEEKQNVEAMLDSRDTDILAKQKSTNYISITEKAYIPQAMALKLCRKIDIPYGKCIWVSKFANLLMYSICIFLAIKFAKIGKKLIFVIGLIPTSLFIATSFSYDTSVTGFFILGVTLIINELVSKEDKLNPFQTLCGVIAISVGSFSKAVYIPIILILCFLPKQKFYSKKQRILFVSGIVITFLVMISTFLTPTVSGVVNNAEVLYNDSRGGNTSVVEQLKLIFAYPLTYAKLLLTSIYKNLANFFIGYESTTGFAYMGNESGNLYYLLAITIIFVTITGTFYEKYKLTNKDKVIIGVLLFGVISLVWTALYLSFTPVGENAIGGVSPRYYLPLFLPFYLMFSNNSIKCNLSEKRYNQIIMLSCSIILIGLTYKYMVLPYNM